jgi:hypothetical protein
MTRSLEAIRQDLDDRVMRLYGEWPERETCRTAARPFAFFVWLESHHPYLTEVGAWGARGTYQHISALVAQWESIHGELERTS